MHMLSLYIVTKFKCHIALKYGRYIHKDIMLQKIGIQNVYITNGKLIVINVYDASIV